jgi:hypothetical protein
LNFLTLIPQLTTCSTMPFDLNALEKINGFRKISCLGSNDPDFSSVYNSCPSAYPPRNNDFLNALLLSFKAASDRIVCVFGIEEKQMIELVSCTHSNILKSPFLLKEILGKNEFIGPNCIPALFNAYSTALPTIEIGNRQIELFQLKIAIIDNDNNAHIYNYTTNEYALDCFRIELKLCYFVDSVECSCKVPAPARPLNARPFKECRCAGFSPEIASVKPIHTSSKIVEITTPGDGNNCLLYAIRQVLVNLLKEMNEENFKIVSSMIKKLSDFNAVRNAIGVPSVEEIEYQKIHEIMNFISADNAKVPNIYILLVFIPNSVEVDESKLFPMFHLFSNDPDATLTETISPIALRSYHYQPIQFVDSLGVHCRRNLDMIRYIVESYFNCNVNARVADIINKVL